MAQTEASGQEGSLIIPEQREASSAHVSSLRHKN